MKWEDNKLKEYLDEVNSYRQKHVDAVSCDVWLEIIQINEICSMYRCTVYTALLCGQISAITASLGMLSLQSAPAKRHKVELSIANITLADRLPRTLCVTLGCSSFTVGNFSGFLFLKKKTNDELAKAFEAHRDNLELMIGPEQALHGILPSQNILDCKFKIKLLNSGCTLGKWKKF